MKRFEILVLLWFNLWSFAIAQDFEIVNNNFLSENYRDFINISGNWSVDSSLGFLDLGVDVGTDEALFQLPDFCLKESNTTWNFKFEFNAEKPTSSNYFNIVICGDSLSNGIGFGVGKGNNKACLSLLRFTDSKTTVLAQSTDSIKKNIEYDVRITRSFDGVWTLSLDDRDLLSYTENVDFDFLIKQTIIKYCFSKKYPSKFLLKSFSIYQNYPLDIDGFKIVDFSVEGCNSIKVFFNNIIDKQSCQDVGICLLENIYTKEISIEEDLKTLTLFFEEPFVAGEEYSLILSGISNRLGMEIDECINFSRKKITLQSSEFINSTTLKLVFSDFPQNIYDINIYSINENKPQKNIVEDSVCYLTFENTLDFGQELVLRVDGLLDADGVTFYNFTQSFCFASRGQIVINEIMADINPAPNNLPAKKYIELYNTSPLDFRLDGYTISNDGENITSLVGTISSKNFLIISADSAAFSIYGNSVGGLNEKSVTVAGKKLVLKNIFGQVIDSLSYSLQMYGDKSFSSGGYSLERINPQNICNQSINWHVTNSDDGGTPGSINTVLSDVFDNVAPQLSECIVIKTDILNLLFNENIDSLFNNNVSNYLIDGYLQPLLANYGGGNLMILTLPQKLSVGEHYINIKKSSDLCGNISENQDFMYFDNKAVVLRDVEILDDYCILLHFDGLIESSTAINIDNFVVDDSFSPSYSGIYPKDSTCIILQFSESLDTSRRYVLDVKNLRDYFGNLVEGQRVFGNSEPYFDLENVDIYVENEVFCPSTSDGYLKISVGVKNYPILIDRIEIYDKYGIKRRTILSSYDLYSREIFCWDGLDDAGKKCPVGIYIVYVLLREHKPIKLACVLSRFSN